jgi:hypothetical protein
MRVICFHYGSWPCKVVVSITCDGFLLIGAFRRNRSRLGASFCKVLIFPSYFPLVRHDGQFNHELFMLGIELLRITKCRRLKMNTSSYVYPTPPSCYLISNIFAPYRLCLICAFLDYLPWLSGHTSPARSTRIIYAGKAANTKPHVPS